MQGLSSEDRATLHELFVQLLGSYRELLDANGETRLYNNVAGATAFLLAASRYVLTDGEELSEAASEALLQEINSLLASAAGFQRMSAEERQRMAESLAITGGWTFMLYQQGLESGDAELLAQGKELARSTLGQFFDMPLEQVRFTDAGVQFD
jgi:flagellar biosynthesis/type III secretory pathway protein FliH